MRYFAVSFLLLTSGLALPACAQKATPAKAATKPSAKPSAAKPGTKAKNEAGPVITFERTPCFGFCPTYTMQVYANGRVAYEGRRAVPLMGQQELKLPAAAVADLLRMAKEARFEQFQDKYSRGTTDLPSTIIAIRQPNGQLKTVVVEEGAPENVQALTAYFITQFDKLAQVGVNPER
ncbi:MAG TPA: DUF6438 domain-containing protein [Hymenobacter sp.]|jgi:hypothetical protein|uniref:DUF6438 domain-containing protein n=1 Tax=Hymenobacter sp. TaxID=1898978 RepID=UPI002ED830A3